MSKRWLGVLVLMIVVSISYMDRINVSLMITDKDFLDVFGLANDRVAQGRLVTVFLIGYGISAWFLTPLFEARWSVRTGLLASLVLWMIFTGVSAVTGSLMLLLAWRVLLGVAEGPLFSLKTMYVSEHFASGEVGKPNAVSSLGVSIGLAAGFPVVTYLINLFGWRGSFFALATLNLAIGLPLVLAFVHPRRDGAGGATKTDPKSRDGMMDLVRTAFGTPHLVPILLIEIATLSYPNLRRIGGRMSAYQWLSRKVGTTFLVKEAQELRARPASSCSGRRMRLGRTMPRRSRSAAWAGSG